MIIHVVLLFSESIAIIVRVVLVKNNISFHYRMIVYSSLFSIDLLVQMLICYICYTQGSSIQLAKFECVID